MWRSGILAFALFAGLSGPAAAQDSQTLADIRQELSILYVEILRLKQELNTTGAPSVDLEGTSVLERIDAIESEMRRLTGRTEELEFRIDRIVTDGTNRIGDLEFRLCELETDCDIGSLGETPTLGGGELPAAPSGPVIESPEGEGDTQGAEMAVGEREAFDRAKEELDSGSFRSAAELFAAFTEDYSGGPLTAEAHYFRGVALNELGETAGAARAFLSSFSGAPEGRLAPDALLALGLALRELGQTADACITLGEVSTRYPDSEASVEAQSARGGMDCF